MSEAIETGLGEGITEILGMKKGGRAQELYLCPELIRGSVPTLIVFTKFDLLVSRVQFDITRGVFKEHEHPGSRAHMMYKDLCRSLFRECPKDVPAAIFSGNCLFVWVSRKAV